MTLQAIYTLALPTIGTILAALVTVFMPIAIKAVFDYLKKVGIEVEAHRRDALQSALSNAAVLAIKNATGAKDYMTQPASQVEKFAGVVPNVGVAIDYVKQSVPDAVKEFKLDTNRIKELLQPHIVTKASELGVTTKSN